MVFISNIFKRNRNNVKDYDNKRTLFDNSIMDWLWILIAKVGKNQDAGKCKEAVIIDIVISTPETKCSNEIYRKN
jgi:hypothetical protein